MKALIVTVLLGFVLPVLAQVPASDSFIGDSSITSRKNQPLRPMTPVEAVNRWILISLNTKKALLKGAGPIECRHVVTDHKMGDYQYAARGQTIDLAHGRVGALCIKNRCENLSQIVADAKKNSPKVSEEDLAEFYRAQGLSDEEVARSLEARRVTSDDLSKAKCETAPQDIRDLIYTSCFVTPIECHQQ